MKAVYVKPRLNVEYFSLTQSVAAHCGWDGGLATLGEPSHDDRSSCGWRIGDDIYFVAVPSCTEIRDENTDVFGMCYNNPDGGQQIFAS